MTPLPPASSSFTSGLALSRYELDRDYVRRRADDLLPTLRADDATRVLALHDGRALLAGPARLRLVRPADVPADALALYLGLATRASEDLPEGGAVVAVQLDDAAAARFEGEWGDLRLIGAELSDRDAGMFTEALGLLNWHASHAFSPRSGRATTPVQGGWVRIDPEDGTEIFPRTDPAIIVGITDDDDRMLLGSNSMWQGNRWSVLAGFVEPGESIESAVQREVFEESGVRVAEPEYLGSQPWPFPASLMLGFSARVAPGAGTELRPDGDEILDLRWFTRDELAAALGDVLLPGPSSIAHAIIERWYGRPLTREVTF